MIDHSLLHPTLTDAQLESGCRLASAFEVATACVKPYHVPRARELFARVAQQAPDVLDAPQRLAALR